MEHDSCESAVRGEVKGPICEECFGEVEKAFRQFGEAIKEMFDNRWEKTQ